MKTNKIVVYVSFVILLIAGLVFVSWKTSTNASPAPTVVATAQPDQNLKTFTAKELKKYDGKNGNPAYIAVNGVVYDVSKVGAWANGSHNGYRAGVDLSDAIKKAPHGLSVLKNLPVVGKYVKE